MRKLQLFVLLQDTIFYIQTGAHLAPNYHHCKSYVMNRFAEFKDKPLNRCTAKQLLVLIGCVYDENGWFSEFEEYMLKCDDRDSMTGILDIYNEQLEKML